MTEQTQQSNNGAEPVATVPQSQTFMWHPVYKGRTFESVGRELLDEIRRDQRAYELSLEAAEQNEHASLQAIIKLDNRWCAYDLGWTEANVEQLADRAMQIEIERERRHEMFPVKEMRDALPPVSTATGVQPASEEISRSLGISRWAYIVVTVLVIIGLVVLGIQVF
ncbi:MAG: hypothetical protein ACR2OU_15535 [Thermomicrobiales bacterium]